MKSISSNFFYFICISSSCRNDDDDDYADTQHSSSANEIIEKVEKITAELADVMLCYAVVYALYVDMDIHIYIHTYV